MYLTLPQSTFRQAVSQVAHLAGNKSALPLLQQVLLQASEGMLQVYASNEETSVCACVEANVQASGSLLLPAKLLASFVPDLPQAPLTLVSPAPSDPKKTLVRCAHARVLLQQPSGSPDEFPVLPTLADDGVEKLLLLDCELLKDLITQVAFAAADDLKRPALGAVYLELENGHATVAAADSFRLATRTIAIPDTRRSQQLLIPAGALLDLARLLPASGAIQVATVGQQVLFHTDHLTVAIRLLREAYPNFRAVIPTTVSTRTVLSIATVSSALRVLEPFARANDNRLSLTIRGGEASGMLLHASAPDLGENELELAATVTGPDQTVLLNVRWFAELLAALPGQEVALEMTGPRQPLALRPVGPLDAVSVVMPMHVAPTAPPVPRVSARS